MKKGIGKKAVLKVLGKVAEFEANMVNDDRLPICIGIVYQPERPKKFRS